MISDGRTVDDILDAGEAIRTAELRRTVWRPILATVAFFAMTVICILGRDVESSTRMFNISTTGVIALMMWGLHFYAADLTATESKLDDALAYLTDEPEDDEPEA